MNAMKLVNVCKDRLQAMRESGWVSLLERVSNFYNSHDIEVLKMDAMFLVRGRKSRKSQPITNLHHYRVEVFYVIDMQLQELNNRYTESSTELLLCIACLNPSNSFVAFNRQKLSRLAQFFPRNFSAIELSMLEDQFQNYIIDIRSKFVELKSIGDIAVKMVVTKRYKIYPLVYRLLTLALILLIAIATVERTFSAMNIVKTRLHNRMGDQWMKDLLNKLDNKHIMDRFQNMRTRTGQL
ncbi:uncharacterized protein LOC103496885 [Cucumis melo]|uniref:Uncharacterized protein LOC103496885 n=1 Tax=Cucumis melo TaxID=3656 RepID=A0A1S3C638_CUCME|nr:uncharacterized protein LOC103496885 [Cucumis melo]